MAWQRVPGTAGRYVDTDTGITISRRAYENMTRGPFNPVTGRSLVVEQRERRYRERLAIRRETRGLFEPQTLSDNRRYWRQRWAEQYAGRHGITDAEARRIADRPGSEFNRLWSAAEAQGFDGGLGSAWDELARASGARGGEESENERNKYLAVISWYQQHGEIGEEEWLEKDSDGHFTWPGMPSDVRNVA